MTSKTLRITTALTTLSIAVFLTACGGGSSSSTPAPVAVTPPASGPSDPVFTKDVFENEDKFKDRCENPRSGNSPVTGNAYPDIAGSTVEEKFWLRSWNNNTYLWYDEVEDIDPYEDSTRLEYFDKLKTFAVTPSGKDKDEFHFYQDTADFEQRRSGGATVSYGARYRFFSTTPPRKLVIAYTEPGSIAATSEGNQLFRGTEILEVDGVDLVNGSDVDTLNAGLFPSEDGETHTFKVLDAGATETRTITLAAEGVTTKPVNTTKVITADNGDKVGYVHMTTFSPFTTEEAIITAMTEMQDAGINDLVLDLRYNGGGLLDIAGQTAYMIAGANQTTDKVFDKIVFNDKHPTINPVTGETLTPIPFHRNSLGFSVDAGQALPSVNLGRVFILSTDNTCSASESVINGLRGIDVEVILIGGRTCGKPYGFYSTDNCGVTYSTIQLSAANDKDFGEYADGFLPDNSSEAFGVKIKGCELGDDFTKPLGDETETLLSAALFYQQNGSCPVSATTKPNANASLKLTPHALLNVDTKLDLLSDPRVKAQFMFEQNGFLDPRLSRQPPKGE